MLIVFDALLYALRQFQDYCILLYAFFVYARRQAAADVFHAVAVCCLRFDYIRLLRDGVVAAAY